MKKRSTRTKIAVPAILLAALAVGCGVPRSLVGLVKPSRPAEQYRVEGVVCTQPEEVLGEQGIVMGRRFGFAKHGRSCANDARDVFVAVGRVTAMKVAGKLQINQRVTVTGALEGAGKETIIATRLVPQRR